MGAVTAVDLHQHLWPEAVLRVLEGRRAAPRARWRAGAWLVQSRAEPAFVVDPADHDPGERVRRLAAIGADRAIVALSPPVAAESVPGAVAAWSCAAAALPDGLGWWAAVAGGVPGAEQAAVMRDAISCGATGLCLSAGALGSPARAEATLALLAELDRSGGPVFVHPGEPTGGATDPAWWSPATSYVAQMHIAWHAFHAVVRPALPSLRAIFALLAGLAPMHLERSVGRGAALAAGADDPLSFYDTSSYGPASIAAMAQRVGTSQLVYGSDHPVAPLDDDPLAGALGEDLAERVRCDNPARVLGSSREAL